MKKTTKKLISIFLSLMMVLSLIPMNSLNVYAELHPNASCSENPNNWHWHCRELRSSDGKYVGEVYNPDSGTLGNSNYAGNKVQLINGQSPEIGKWYYDTTGHDDWALCSGVHGCGKCLTCGHSASQHEGSECLECSPTEPCTDYGTAKREFCVLGAGHTGPCSATLPKTYDGTDDWGIYYNSSFTVQSPKVGQSSSFALGDIFNNVQNRASSATVYCDGVVVAKASYVSGTVVKVDSDKLYICTNHTGSYGTLCETCTVDTTPEWVDTIVAKVDASADKLVDDKGTPFANMLMGGKFADTFIQYESVEYDNDGSVYIIKGVGHGAEGEYIITLDSNEDVASLVTNYYDAGALLFSVTYKKKAPTFGSSSSVVEEKQEETTPAPAPVTEETSVTKVIVPSKSKIKVTVNKVDGVDGYQIQYGRVKSFKKSKKTITTKKTVKTIKVKKPGKKYYVRVRSFKIVNGKKVYSKWSKIKSIKTK